MKIAKTDHPSYGRDLENKALVNTDTSGLNAYKLRKRALRQTDNRINNLEAKVDQMNATLSEILNILRSGK